MGMSRFWNKKTKGLLGAFYQLVPAYYYNILDKYSTKVQRLNLLKAGVNSTIQCKTIICDPNNITLGDNVNIGRYVRLSSEIPTSKLTIGNGTTIAQKSHLDYSGNLTIGVNCTVSEEVMVETHDHGLDPYNKAIPLPLEIEDNVWIGTRATIMHNVSKIGKNSIVGACSVVTKDVPENVIVAGNPARIIKKIER